MFCIIQIKHWIAIQAITIDEEKLEIIKQTIMNSWQSFHGINDFGKFKKKSTSYDLEKYMEIHTQ